MFGRVEMLLLMPQKRVCQVKTTHVIQSSYIFNIIHYKKFFKFIFLGKNMKQSKFSNFFIYSDESDR